MSPAVLCLWVIRGHFSVTVHQDKVDVVIAPTALHLGHVKAPLEGLGMQVRLCIALDGHGYARCRGPRDIHNAS